MRRAGPKSPAAGCESPTSASAFPRAGVGGSWFARTWPAACWEGGRRVAPGRGQGTEPEPRVQIASWHDHPSPDTTREDGDRDPADAGYQLQDARVPACHIDSKHEP